MHYRTTERCFRALPASEADRAAWRLRSSFVLDEWVPRHEETLASWSLTDPLPSVLEADAFLIRKSQEQRWAAGLRSVGAVLRAGWIGVRRPLEDHPSAMFPPIYAPAKDLQKTAHAMACDLDCPESDAVGFLLTGRPFDLPWIDVLSASTSGPIGMRFSIRIGVSDITAEDVRTVYSAARRHFLGTDTPRALPDHAIALIILDAWGRQDGKTWNERHRDWLAYAREWSLYSDSDRGALKYHSLPSYRNYVEKLRKKHTWVRDELAPQPARIVKKGGADDA